MKFIGVFLVSFVLVTACNFNENTAEKLSNKGDVPSGMYRANIGFDHLMTKNEIDTADGLTKMLLSFASLLEVRVNFQDNGYLKVEGDFGFFNFPTISDTDSIKYHIEGEELIMEDSNIEINDDEPIYIRKTEEGFSLFADSLEIKLIPVEY
jgi:hypothetical protein